MTASEIQGRLRGLGSPEAAAMAARFFKTGPGQYGEGDIFLGLRAKDMHQLSKEHTTLPIKELRILLKSPVHEDRMLALDPGSPGGQGRLGRQGENLQTVSRKHSLRQQLGFSGCIGCGEIVGGHLADKSREPLLRLAGSKNLWERRISIVATHYFIRQNDFADTTRIALLLIGDKEDLIHKAVGWMLREVGKKHQPTLEVFLRRHGKVMPRTALRLPSMLPERAAPGLSQRRSLQFRTHLKSSELDRARLFRSTAPAAAKVLSLRIEISYS